MNLNSRERDLAEIKQQWRTMKLDAKKNMSQVKTSIKCTGGGPKPPSPDPETIDILSMIPQEFETDSNIFDSDSIANQEVECVMSTQEYVLTPLDKKENVEESSRMQIESFKGDAQWYARDGHFYVASRARGASIYMRCHSNRCPARWTMKDGQPGPITGVHDHDPTPWVESRNNMFQALKRRAASESTPLNTLYREEVTRHPDGAPHLLYETMVSSMRLWRRSLQPGGGVARLPNSHNSRGYRRPLLPPRDGSHGEQEEAALRSGLAKNLAGG
ncbi:uncharacterized protein LOC113238760 [Hyposmocoma kahamanoa]|uniref:uncharacterized protein LOC113235672 n=1 Tax=Hyposmocoma kahamanoa TaxID=1477025 RepID=UPI000E6D9857|nr:uncharacterized protein LOC113235672 [Hyposmocoma kahamanoa]XP_026331380.1 uncharacterized protein LOC113238760 [Hyposmocoma kahamanoa]XP_026331381.1 uncharacterized protein LOC113238760 [Hyposmocoma kahamanoa]